jgi:hypothetical protein
VNRDTITRSAATSLKTLLVRRERILRNAIRRLERAERKLLVSASREREPGS